MEVGESQDIDISGDGLNDYRVLLDFLDDEQITLVIEEISELQMSPEDNENKFWLWFFFGVIVFIWVLIGLHLFIKRRLKQ